MPDIRALLRRVGEILISEWDPIGVAKFPAASDEYDAYVPRIAKALFENRSVSDISAMLVGIETASMGLAGNPERAMRAARLLLEARRPLR